MVHLRQIMRAHHLLRAVPRPGMFLLVVIGNALKELITLAVVDALCNPLAPALSTCRFPVNTLQLLLMTQKGLTWREL